MYVIVYQQRSFYLSSMLFRVYVYIHSLIIELINMIVMFICFIYTKRLL